MSTLVKITLLEITSRLIFVFQLQNVPKTCCKLSNSDPENPQPTNYQMCQLEAVMPSSNPTVTSANYAYLKAEVSGLG